VQAVTHIAQYWQSGGPLMWPIAAASAGIWFYFLRSREWLGTVVEAVGEVECELEGAGDARTLESQVATWHTRPGVLSQAVVLAMEAWRRQDSPSEAFARAQDTAVSRLSRDLTVLAALTSAAPLLGLLGTVLGMIATFQAVSQASGDTAARVAGGISQALITTQFGLVVAIPGFFGVARLHRLQDQVHAGFQRCRSRLLVVLARRGITPMEAASR